jgi:hypothetical protein
MAVDYDQMAHDIEKETDETDDTDETDETLINFGPRTLRFLRIPRFPIRGIEKALYFLIDPQT